MLGIKPRIVVIRSLVASSEAVAYSADLYRFYAGPRTVVRLVCSGRSEAFAATACYICLQLRGFD